MELNEKKLEKLSAESQKFSNIQHKPLYISRKEMLEITRHNRLIADTPLGVHDLIIVEETDGLVALYLNRRILEFLDYTKVVTINRKGNTLYFKDYAETLSDHSNIYEFTDENFQFVVAYTNVRDEILNPIRTCLTEGQVICYSNVTFVFDNVSETLRFELLDTDGEIPIESAILSKKLLQMTQNRHWLNEIDTNNETY